MLRPKKLQLYSLVEAVVVVHAIVARKALVQKVKDHAVVAAQMVEVVVQEVVVIANI